MTFPLQPGCPIQALSNTLGAMTSRLIWARPWYCSSLRQNRWQDLLLPRSVYTINPSAFGQHLAQWFNFNGQFSAESAGDVGAAVRFPNLITSKVEGMPRLEPRCTVEGAYAPLTLRGSSPVEELHCIVLGLTCHNALFLNKWPFVSYFYMMTPTVIHINNTILLFCILVLVWTHHLAFLVSSLDNPSSPASCLP